MNFFFIRIDWLKSMGVVDKWSENVFNYQMKKLNQKSRQCVYRAINGPPLSLPSINSLTTFKPVFKILFIGFLSSFIVLIFEFSPLFEKGEGKKWAIHRDEKIMPKHRQGKFLG